MSLKSRLIWVISLLAAIAFVFTPGINARAEGDELEDPVTITFNYGLQEEYMIENDYIYNDITYSHSITVKAGEYLSYDGLTLPQYGDELGSLNNKMKFSYWMDNNGNSVYPMSQTFYEDTTLYARYDHVITYHAGEGKFFSGNKTYSETLSENDTLLDVSVCCYPNGTDRAFIGWALKENATANDVIDVDDGIDVYQNIDLYAVFDDGYPLTFFVNTENGTINSYYESYKGNRKQLRTLSGNNKSITFTYPNGVKPSEANYFSYDPFYNPEYRLSSGDDSVIYNFWSNDADGKSYAYFDNLTPAGDGNDSVYAIWETYYTVTFDSNRGEGYNYSRDVKVAKGSRLNNVPYTSFGYTDDDNKSWKCVSFNSEKNGSGEEITYNFIPTKNITVYAEYTEIYYIYLDGNGGYIDTYYTTFEVEKGEEFNITNDYNVTWYDDEGEETSQAFSYWNTKEDGTGMTPPFTPTESTTVYAIPNDGVRVTFTTDARNGDEGNEYGTLFSYRDKYNVTNATFTFSKERAMGYLPSPNYINDDLKSFAGWSTVYGDTSKVIDSQSFIPDKDMTLYATWYDMVPVRYHANGGRFSPWDDNDIIETNVIKGKKFTPYNSETPYMSGGYIFEGWASRDGSSAAISYGKTYTAIESMDFYAVWEKGYNITIDANGGNIHYMDPSGHEHHGETENATFAIKKGAPVISNTSGSWMDLLSGWHEDNLILAGVSKTKDGEPVDLSTYIPEKDETFYAIWDEPCEVTFDPGEGIIEEYYSATSYVAKGETVYSLPEVKSETKIFVGWFTDIGTDKEKVFDTDTVVEDDITVTAKWSDTSEKVKINFVAGKDAYIYDNGVNVPKLSIEVGKGAYIDLQKYHAFQNGISEKQFRGWESDSYTWNQGSSGRYFTATADISFTAIWSDAEYVTVTFDGNGGMVEAADSDKENAKTMQISVRKDYVIGEIIAATKDDDISIFTGWYFDKECTKLATNPSGIEMYYPGKDVTLYAGWREKTIPVTGISIAKNKITLGISEGNPDTYKLNFIIYPTNATNDKVTYSSDMSSVASVSSSGVIKAEGTGEAIITITTKDGGFKATCKVIVTGVTASSVNDKIDNLTAELGSVSSPKEAEEKVKQALEEIGGADRLSELAASNSETAAKIKNLEDAYKSAANITVEDPDNHDNRNVLKNVFGMAEEDIHGTLDVTGAALNAKSGETVGLSIKTVPENKEKDIDNKYENAKQLDIDLVKGDKKVEELDSAVTFTLPIPTGTIRSKLYVLHFNPDGSYELIRPVFKNNKMYITVSHFSIFAIVELADNASGGNGGTATPTATPSKTPAKPTETPAKTPVKPTEVPANTATPSVSPSATPTVTPDAVKEGETVSESGATATYKVASAADKTVIYTGDSKASKKVTVKSTIKVGNDTYTVVAIADNAFKKKSITAVTIPATVKSIGKSAFEGCTKLKTVTIKGTSLTTIGDKAFRGCKVLGKITVPKSVTKVGKQAFENCAKLKTITVKSKKTKFLKNAFKKVPKSSKIKLPKMTSKEKKSFKKMLKKAGFKGKVK